MFDPAFPFVLLDDACPGGRGILYTRLAGTIEARQAEEVGPALDAIGEAVRGGTHVAGWLGYEAGEALELGNARGTAPLLWLGLFKDRREVDVATLLPDSEGGWLGKPVPELRRDEYERAVERVQALIAAGDVYQVNLTYRARVAAAGAPLALYAGIRARNRGGHGALVFTGEQWLLSASPELLFELDQRRIVTRPMKGTAPRHPDRRHDLSLAEALGNDAKQRAENLMIVDLLRNDMSKVATPGSVAVSKLFEVETYPTVHQMTSTVVAELAEGATAVDVLRALFPCGSVTGAPKRRAMEVIGEVEPGPRGAYTGSIGAIEAEGRASFNVAIRSLSMDRFGSVTMGLGSGIVADSRADDEWAECAAKGAFVASTRPFDLFETMRFDPERGILRLESHLQRLLDSCATFGFRCDRHDARNELQAATFRLRDHARVRLFMSPEGAASVLVDALPPIPDGVVPVALVPLPVPNADFRLRHKTTDRAFYGLPPLGAFEQIYVDRDGFVTEGSFTCVYVEGEGGVLRTPPLARGLLPGVLRAELIGEGRAREDDVKPADLANGFLIGNSLRGLLPARLVSL